MTPTIAIVADIHSNLEALRAVMSDITSQHADLIYCLGDIVGYGPDPCECLDVAMTFDICVIGDHDRLALEGKADHPTTHQNVLWTRRQLAQAPHHGNAPDQRRVFLRGLRRTHRHDDTLYVHGSPPDPLHEYVFPEYIYVPDKLKSIFQFIDTCCFVGHTHLPGVFTPQAQFHCPEQIGYTWNIRDAEKTLCNVGSVGQPRDEDHRACYCLFDGETIRYRRVSYDVGTTARKIRDRDQ